MMPGNQMETTMTALELMKLLADDTRLTSVLMMAAGPRCVCDLMTALDLSQPKVSRHLAILREAGLVATERRGQWIYYSLSPDFPLWASDIIRVAASAPDVKRDPRLKAAAGCEAGC